jgi:FeS assembly SUF system protein
MLLHKTTQLTPLEEKIVKRLTTVCDPEIPVNIYDLGLIYDVKVSEENNVEITMTLTSPGCPMLEEMLQEIEDKVQSINEVNHVKTTITFNPPWDYSRLSDEAKLELGLL